MRRRLTIATLALGMTAAVLAAPTTYADQPAPSAARGPGPNKGWTEADKTGFGTAHSRQSRVWFTLQDGRVSEVFYPDLSTPSLRTLELMVIDGRARRQPDPRHDDRGDEAGRAQPAVHPGQYRPRRPLPAHRGDRHRPGPQRARHPRDRRVPGRREHTLGVRYEPGSGQRHRPTTTSAAPTRSLKAVDRQGSGGQHAGEQPEAVRRQPGPGLHQGSEATISLGFAQYVGELVAGGQAGAGPAVDHDVRSVRRRLARLSREHQTGPGQRRSDPARVPRLRARPRGRRGQGPPGRLRRESERAVGLGRRGQGPQRPVLGVPRGLVARPLPDRHRPLRHGRRGRGPARGAWLFRTQQKKDGSFPQNSDVDGTEEWTEIQLDQVTLPIALAHLVGQTDKRTYRGIKKAVGFLMKFRDEETGRKAPFSPQERWENQSGYSPATIAAEIDGLVTGAAIARQHGDREARQELGAHRRQVGAQGQGLDDDDQRPAQRRAVLPARDEGRQTRQGHEVRHR